MYCHQKLLIGKLQQSTAIDVLLFECIGVACFSKAVSLVLSQCWVLNALEQPFYCNQADVGSAALRSLGCSVMSRYLEVVEVCCGIPV